MQHCNFERCEAKPVAKGYCSKHYYSAQRRGLLPRPSCSVANCESPSFRKGMCNTHHLRTERYGSPFVVKKMANGSLTGKICIIDGCDKPQRQSQMCSIHAARKRNLGDPLATPKKLGNGQATEERKRENRKRAQQNYYKTVHGKLRRRFANARRRVLSGAASEHLSKEQFIALWNTSSCAICRANVTDADKSVDHIIPLARGGGNEMSNLQIAHLVCNQRKNRFIHSAGVG